MVGAVARIASTWWDFSAWSRLVAGMGSQWIVAGGTLSLLSTDQAATVSWLYGRGCLPGPSVGINEFAAVPIVLPDRSPGLTICDPGRVRISITLGPAS